MADTKLAAELRSDKGSRPAGRLRREGGLPGIVAPCIQVPHDRSGHDPAMAPKRLAGPAGDPVEERGQAAFLLHRVVGAVDLSGGRGARDVGVP